MQGIILEYKECYQNKVQLIDKLKRLEKEYLKALINSCMHDETVCDNCWEKVRLRKSISDHQYNGAYICKKRTIEFRILEVIDKCCHDISKCQDEAESESFGLIDEQQRK